jgi:hypothetical protein
VVALAFALSCCAQHNVQRTMTLLAKSTPQKRNAAKVLFYGRSITRQDQRDHITWLPEEGAPPDQDRVKREAWHDRHSFERLRDPLSDSVHLDSRGSLLLAELVKPHLRYDPAIPRESWEGLVSDYKPEWKDGRLLLEFEGNRADLITARRGRRTLRLKSGQSVDLELPPKSSLLLDAATGERLL